MVHAHAFFLISPKPACIKRFKEVCMNHFYVEYIRAATACLLYDVKLILLPSCTGIGPEEEYKKNWLIRNCHSTTLEALRKLLYELIFIIT